MDNTGSVSLSQKCTTLTERKELGGQNNNNNRTGRGRAWAREDEGGGGETEGTDTDRRTESSFSVRVGKKPGAIAAP